MDTARDLFDFAQQEYTRPKNEEHVHYKRTFFFVPKEEVNQTRVRLQNLKPIPNTRGIHSVKMIEPYIVMAQERSCFCEVCMSGHGTCISKDATGDGKVVDMRKRGRKENPDMVRNFISYFYLK